jgi:DUF1680 family protein
VDYDLPNRTAYTETCAAIALVFFCHRMFEATGEAKYQDVLERALYNGVLSGISMDGKSFFYENPLAIDVTFNDVDKAVTEKRRYPITQRLEVFGCSCCPPNINRLLPKLSEYVYGIDGDTLYINQFANALLEADGIRCEMQTEYPANGKITLKADGVSRIAIRIPSWCESYTLDKAHDMQNGYAVFTNDGTATLTLDMTPFAIRANTKVRKDRGRLCVEAGPIVYCAESIDNGEDLHALAIPTDFTYRMRYDESYGLNVLAIDGYRYEDRTDSLYTRARTDTPIIKPTVIKMIPYACFANRGECDMLTWLPEHRA